MKRTFTLIILCLLGFHASGQEKIKGYPKFSWDKIPVYIHFGKSEGLTDKEIEFVATHSDLVCFEKGHGTADAFHDRNK